MKFYKSKYLILLFLPWLFTHCQKPNFPIEISAEDFHQAQDQLTSVMVHDIFSPPVASRVYVYSNIAAYEILAQKEGNQYITLSGILNDFNGISPIKDSLVNPKLAALIAFIGVGKNLIFSVERISDYLSNLSTQWKKQNLEVYNASNKYAQQVVGEIKLWYDKDNYNQTRTFPKFYVDYDSPSRWQPTPPDYMDGIEPHWSKIRPLVLTSSSQFQPEPPPIFSMEPDSEFYKELMEVYHVVSEIQESESDDERQEIAKFWDCNPYVSTHKGHVMFALKKISPGAHWIGITKIVSRKINADVHTTVAAYTKVSIALADGFISCWDEKYRSNLIRPETIINKVLDEDWYPVLQTPPFPEYTSGHSVVSGAASVILTDLFGDNIAFDDDTELPYDLPIRSYRSFNHAAEEAAISRMYGGIHYRKAIDEGLKQGRDLGEYVSKKLGLQK
ncbi:MAG: phosphatidic acid phosphatase [Flavobacteriaceae bacterium]|nr:phosphatidic acid phosphatase [Flavobacteriaceae bacterium]|tara:strand:+ start:1200 stop:2537 length:1338 start_codon:yes stop_codon:yes gene_type:complete